MASYIMLEDMVAIVTASTAGLNANGSKILRPTRFFFIFADIFIGPGNITVLGKFKGDKIDYRSVLVEEIHKMGVMAHVTHGNAGFKARENKNTAALRGNSNHIQVLPVFKRQALDLRNLMPGGVTALCRIRS